MSETSRPVSGLSAWCVVTEVVGWSGPVCDKLDYLANWNDAPRICFESCTCAVEYSSFNIVNRVAGYCLFSLLLFGCSTGLASFVFRKESLNVLSLRVAVHVGIVRTPVVEVQSLGCTDILLVAVNWDYKEVAALWAVGCVLAQDKLVGHRDWRCTTRVKISRAVCHLRLQSLKGTKITL